MTGITSLTITTIILFIFICGGKPTSKKMIIALAVCEKYLHYPISAHTLVHLPRSKWIEIDGI